MSNSDLPEGGRSPSPREMLVIRLVLGPLGLAFTAIVVNELLKDGFTYGVIDEAGRTGRRVSVGSLAGKVFGFLSFGMMGIGMVAGAVRPRLFADQRLVFAWIALILASFVGLHFSP